MAEIRLEGVRHSYVDHELALQQIDVTWDDGGAYALLGPSGCGKTTMLDIISGLLRPSEGRVLFDGVDVTDRSPVERNIAQVFQFPVLYDSMTVEENMRFPLRNRGVPKAEAQRRAEEVAELLEIRHLLKERARGLPADAKQLVSLARGLVRREVSAILFDEPLTVIDPQRKWALRQALKRVHAELSHTLVYVTHDQTEALTFADVVVVMNEGRILQRGTPDELFERPAHRFVGHFIGSPGMNFLPCRVRGRMVAVAGVDLLRLPEEPQPATGSPGDAGTADTGAAGADVEGADVADASDAAVDARHVVGIRPDFVRCVTSPSALAIAAEVGGVRDLGATLLVQLTLSDGSPLVAKLPAAGGRPGSQCWVELPPERLQVFRDGHLVPAAEAGGPTGVPGAPGDPGSPGTSGTSGTSGVTGGAA
jgi:glycerol transport system ATP-binding protein